MMTKIPKRRYRVPFEHRSKIYIGLDNGIIKVSSPLSSKNGSYFICEANSEEAFQHLQELGAIQVDLLEG